MLLIAGRIALPVVVKNFVNDTLQGLNGYSGSVDDIDISLWRGAYQIKGLNIVKTGGKVPVPFVEAAQIDLSVQWKALIFDQSIVAEIELDSPKLNFVNSKSPAKSQSKVDESWTETVRKLTPFEVNLVTIHDGQVHYRDLESEPRVDIFIQHLEATAHNLTNSQDLGGTMYATVDANALAMGSGKVRLHARADPYADQATFETTFRLDGLQIKQLNSFLKAYANVDAEKGTFSLDAQFSAKNGKFNGYAKPFVKDLQLVNWKDEDKGFFGKVWETMVGAVADIFTDGDKDQIATRIPFSGTIKSPGADVWSTIGGLLRNAFIQSLRRGIEGSIRLDKESRLSKAK